MFYYHLLIFYPFIKWTSMYSLTIIANVKFSVQYSFTARVVICSFSFSPLQRCNLESFRSFGILESNSNENERYFHCVYSNSKSLLH